MDDALGDRHHECEWAAYCDEYDNVGAAIDLLRTQRKCSILVIVLGTIASPSLRGGSLLCVRGCALSSQKLLP